MPVLHRDYETRSRLHLPDVGARRYAGDKSTDIWCAAYAVDDGPVKTWTPGQPIPQEFQSAATDPAWLVSAHNDAFESAIEELLLALRYGWPLIPIERHRCTQAMALAAALPAKLETVAAALNLQNRKDAEGARLMKAMARPRKPRACEDPRELYWVDDPEKLSRLFAYCVQDMEVERELYGRLSPLSDDEQALWRLDAKINQLGFFVDVPLAKAGQKVVRERLAAINAELAELTGGSITTIDQVARISDYLKGRGHEITSVGKRNVAAVLAHKPGSDVERLLRLRQEGGKASANKLDTLLAMVNDDRIRGALKFHGAGTGRWTGHGFQPHNLSRAQPADLEAAIAAVTSGELARVAAIGPPLDVIGSLSRAMIRAAPGKVLISADFSSIEPRVLCWLAGETWKLDAFRKFDATSDLAFENYCLVATHVLGRVVTPDNEEDRQTGKFMELAFGYGGGKGAFRKIAPDANFSDAQVENFKNQWRTAHPNVRKLWGDLHRLLLRTVRTRQSATLRNTGAEMRGDDLCMILPSGRAITYPQARIEPGQFDSDVIVFKDNAQGKWRDKRGWHGLFTENAVQAIARDLLAEAMLRIEAAGYSIVLHVHDEIVAEVDEHFGSPDEFATLMIALPSWAAGLPVVAKASQRARYAKNGKAPADDDVNDSGDDDVDDSEAAPTDDTVEASPELAAAIASMVADIAKGGGSNQGQRANGASGNGDKSGDARGNYNAEHSQAHSGKPYTDAHLRRQGYQFARSFVYALPDGSKLYEERRYELRAELEATEKRPRKTCRFCHVVNGVALFDTGPRRIIYNWPAIMRAGPDATVHITEGANKSAPLNAAGLLATAVAYHQWAPECVSALTGRHLIYHEDHDDNGRKFSADARKKLAPTAASFRIVPAAHLFKKLGREPWPTADVKDWLEAGGDAAKLTEICREFSTENRVIAWLDMSKWDDGEPLPLEWAVPFCIPREQVGLYSGVGGTGKTTNELLKNVAHVLGRPWFGMQPTLGPTFYVGSEDPEKILRIRLTTIARYYNATFEQLIASGLHILNLFGQDATIFFYNNKTLRVETTPLYDQIYQAAGDLKPINIALDPLARIFSGSEIDRTQVYHVVGHSQALSMVSGGSVTLLSHPSLHGISSGSGLSGSTAWHDAFRSRQYLRKVKSEDEDEGVADDETDNGLRELVFMKNQYGPPLAKILLRYQNGLFLPEATPDEFEKTAAEAQADTVFLELLDRLTAQGRNVSASANSMNYAPKLFASQGTGISRKQFEGAMQRLFNANKIRIEKYGPPSKAFMRIVRRDPQS
jgi:DNA polymerase